MLALKTRCYWTILAGSEIVLVLFRRLCLTTRWFHHSRFLVIYNSLKLKQKIIVFSTFTALFSYLLQPLAGSIFSIRQLPESSDSSVTSIRIIGLSPDVSDLSAFAASAGFAEAAVFNGLPDPPFVHLGWAAAQFVFPTNQYLNGSMAVNTTGIETTVNCANPISLNLTTSNPNNFSISAISVDGCPLGPVFFNPNNATQQYGVTNVPSCNGASANISFQPVMFWYYQVKQDNTDEARGVFCTPRVQLFDITAHADLSNGSFIDATNLDNYPKPNNVSGSPLNGSTYNGLIFDSSPDTNVQARATSIRTGVPNAIFRGAAQDPNGLQSVFDNSDGFLDLTNAVYTQYLALAAKSIYFLPNNQTVFAELTQLVPRLWIEPLSAHFLSVVLITLGLMIMGIHIAHHRDRRDVYLTHPPGSIGTAVSQTSRSGFGELLYPYDNEEAIRTKLEGLRFRLDQRTGAIVVDDSVYRYGGTTPDAREEAMATLEGQNHNRTNSGGRGSVTPKEHASSADASMA